MMKSNVSRSRTWALAGLLGAALAAPVHGTEGLDASLQQEHQALLKAMEQVSGHFESNQGQLPSGVEFSLRKRGYRLDLRPEGIDLQLSAKSMVLGEPMQIQFLNHSGAGEMKAGNRRPYQVMQRTMEQGIKQKLAAIPVYGEVRCDEVYRGIGTRYHLKQGKLEYDFEVSPGADPKTIELALSGAREIRLDDEGNLHMKFAAGEMVQHRPVVYQVIEGKRSTVEATYVLRADRNVGFDVGEYDKRHALIIDPVISVILNDQATTRGEPGH